MSRVHKIREDTSPESRNFYPDVQNLADIPSRGMPASELVTESKWCKDPKFLYNFKTETPREENAFLETEGEIKQIVKNSVATTQVLVTRAKVCHSGLYQIIDINRYSSWEKLLRVTAYVLRLTRRSRIRKSLDLKV